MQEKTWIAIQRCPQGAAHSFSHRDLLSSGKSEESDQNKITDLSQIQATVMSSLNTVLLLLP